MVWFGDTSTRHCRWCGTDYGASRPIGKDGFHSKACKQAHYRAYKKWVTAKAGTRPSLKDRKVTQKKPKK